ncbi:MAG: phosphate ABC transporter substrate-binding protein [Paraglaciecola sp.]|uniref:PstS family phosphate ABC transporter substrate-binding protein n=1 Tax=Paraglaciecola sp. TaxID=1920173 RepID=UPI003297014D
MNIYTASLKALLVSSMFVLSTHDAQAIDPQILPYQHIPAFKGKVNSMGSDTLANLMAFWTNEFKVMYPEVEISLHSEGSATAPPALLKGIANIAPMSRKMTANELNVFELKHGYHPTPIKVAIDAIAIFVHKSNPLEHISISQLEAIFSAAPRCMQSSRIHYWRDLIETDIKRTVIDVFGRNADSGTNGFFRNLVLCNGRYLDSMQRLPGNASIVQAISNNPNAIGFSGLGYKTSGVRTLAILHKGKATLPDNIGGTNWEYPLARYLYLYVNKQPDKTLEKSVYEFILYVLSKAGQTTVELDGYNALPLSVIQQELKKIAN